MKIKIITNYCQTPKEKGNNRFNYIATMLSNNEYDVEFITSSFSHRRKQQRIYNEEGLDKLNYKFTMLYEPGYKKNVELKRFYSHHIFARNLKKYLKENCEDADLIYCAIPSLEAAKVACKYAKKHQKKFIIDIQDLWPESFKMVINIPILTDIIYLPFKLDANYVYSRADKIIAVSNTYIKRAKKVASASYYLDVFLGTDLSEFDKYKSQKEENDETIKLVYAGTLGNSYDLKSTFEAIKILSEKGINNLKMIVMGDGPLKNDFEEYANKLNIDCDFTGRLPYNEMIKVLTTCDIAINTIKKGAAQSIINKVGDYAAAGIPVINNQECQEYKDIIEHYNIGLNCNANDSVDMADKIYELCLSKEKRNLMGNNNRKLAEKKFDRKVTYKQILNLIKEYLNEEN